MADFKKIFSDYGGDYDDTMARFMGNESMYLRILPMLFQDENLGKLDSALRNGDFEAAFAAAHTLKGVTGNLGLSPLYHAVCAMVEALRTRDTSANYSSLYQTIADEFERVKQLQEALSAQ